MSTVTYEYTVNSAAYTDAVYPVNIDAPTKEVTFQKEVSVAIPSSHITTTNSTTKSYLPIKPVEINTGNPTHTTNTTTIACLASLICCSCFVWFVLLGLLFALRGPPCLVRLI